MFKRDTNRRVRAARVRQQRLVLFDFNDLDNIPARHDEPRYASYNATIGTPTFTGYWQEIDANGKSGVDLAAGDGTRFGVDKGRAFAWDDVKGPGADAMFTLALTTAGYVNLKLRFDYRAEEIHSFDVSVSQDNGYTFAPLFHRVPLVADDTWRSVEIDLYGRRDLANAGKIIFRFDNFDGNKKFRLDNLEVFGDKLDANFSAPAIDNDSQLLPALCGVIGDPEFPGYTMPFSVATFGTGPVKVAYSISGEKAAVGDIRLEPIGANRWALQIGMVGIVQGLAHIHLHATDPNGNTTTRTIHLGAIEARPAPGTLKTFYPIGAADASAGVFLDESHFLVVNDEDQVLRLYHISADSSTGDSTIPVTTSGHLLPETQTGDTLLLTESREVDIEGIFKVGDRLYMTGALANSTDGAIRPNRNRIFSVGTDGHQFSFVGSYHYLLDDMVAWDQANGHGMGADALGLAAATAEGKFPTDIDGLNVEGLAIMPGHEGGAYMGFRSPLIDNQALLIPILNFMKLAESKKGGKAGTADFGAPMLLDLGGRGIRDMVCNQHGCLILAGPYGDIGGDFAFYTWNGSGAPQMHSADLVNIRPEGILGWNASGGLAVRGTDEAITPQSTVVLVSDLGSRMTYGGIPEQKKLPFKNLKFFRVDYVTLGDVI